MPRIGLKALLRDLRAAGVVRYRKGDTEIVFGGAPAVAGEMADPPPEEGELRRENAIMANRATLKDPLAAALQEFPEIEGDDDGETAN